jgi:hypothetical protein
MRHDAKSAEIVAAVLYFDHAPCADAFFCSAESKAIGFQLIRGNNFTFKMTVKQIENRAFPVVFDGIGYSVV